MTDLSAPQRIEGHEPSRSRQPLRRLRFVTAAALFDGHDASINIMRRILQASGVEVIHLGHNRSVDEVATAALQEDADGVAVSSYQGGHVEYFRYLVELLRARGGAPLLPVSAGPLALGEPGYAYGFSGQGGPSAIHATLLGRARTLQSGRLAGSTPVTAWAERAIVPPGERWIGGMSGGPLTTWDGSVVGIMSVASERRGRIYTVAPEVIAATVRRTGLRFEPPGAEPVKAGPATFDAARAELMNRRSIVQVLCTG